MLHLSVFQKIERDSVEICSGFFGQQYNHLISNYLWVESLETTIWIGMREATVGLWPQQHQGWLYDVKS